MESKETELRQEYDELQAKLQDPAIFSSKDYPKLAKRLSYLEQTLALFDERKRLKTAYDEAKELSMSGDELAELAQAELDETDAKIQAIEEQLSEALTPQDPNNERDCIIEIRAAAGGDESSLFAG